jgi:DNA-binding NarL/FixJ family response regulator
MRIFIVEDHLMFLEAVRKACTRDFGHKVVGATSSGREAVNLIPKANPDLVILDLSLPDMDGFNVAERLLAKMPTLPILVLSAHCDDYTLFRVEQSGVNGFVDKSANTLTVLRKAIAAVCEGRCYYSDSFYAAKLARRSDPRSFSKILSDRERAILTLIGEGWDDTEIAERLGFAVRTASTHRSHILHKLKIKSTAKLITFAVEHGFTSVRAKRGTTPVWT